MVRVFKGAEDFEVVHARDLCGNASRTRAGLDGRGGGGCTAAEGLLRLHRHPRLFILYVRAQVAR